MSQFVETPVRKFTAGGALTIYSRVKTPGALAVAGVGDPDLGTIEVAALASGDVVPVRLRSATGTVKMIAAGAITKGNVVYAAASGKVSTSVNLYPVGIALETVTANNDIVEVLRGVWFGAIPRSIEAHTAGDTLTAAESGSVHTTVGATGEVILVLPAATVGLEFFFYVGAAQDLKIDPDGSETISLPSTGVPGAGGKYLLADLAGETVHLMCAVAGSWACMGYTGTWTAEG